MSANSAGPIHSLGIVPSVAEVQCAKEHHGVDLPRPLDDLALIIELEQQAGNQIDNPALQRFDRLLVVFGEEREIVEDQALFLRRTRVEIDDGTDRRAKLIRRLGMFRDRVLDVRDHLAHVLVQDCEQDRLLGLEVVIQRPAGSLHASARSAIEARI